MGGNGLWRAADWEHAQTSSGEVGGKGDLFDQSAVCESSNGTCVLSYQVVAHILLLEAVSNLVCTYGQLGRWWLSYLFHEITRPYLGHTGGIV